MDIHYCMGKRVGVDFFREANEKCAKCGMIEKKAGCCNDQLVYFKIVDGHKHISPFHLSINALECIVPKYLVFTGFCCAISSNIKKELPCPFISSPPIYLKNRVFRI